METEQPTYLAITQWAEEDRPREKMLNKGASALSDAELIAILLRVGSKSMSAVDLAKQVLRKADYNLNDLAKLNIHDLQKEKGMGEAKALTVMAALELGRRRAMSGLSERPRITNSKDAWLLMMPELMDQQGEQFWIMCLNRANRVVKKTQISKGGITGTVVDVRLVFKEALDCNAVAIILVHNHPSGSVRPSQADINLTNKMAEAGKILQVPVLDHVIFADHEHFSFANEGLL